MPRTKPEPAVHPDTEIDLELPDDPRVSQLVRRLATKQWDIVHSQARRQRVPIERAWMDIYVDPCEITWFYVAVHSPVTRREAWDFQGSLDAYLEAWREGLSAEERELSALISFTVVGLKLGEPSANGS